MRPPPPGRSPWCSPGSRRKSRQCKCSVSDSVRYQTELIWINAASLSRLHTVAVQAMSLRAEGRCVAFESSGYRADLPPDSILESPAPRTVTGHEDELTRIRLREALARVEALLREKDELVRELSAWRENAANHVAGLSPRQRQIMELVVAGQRSKRNRRGARHQPTHRREPSRLDHEENRHEVHRGIDTIGACRCPQRWPGSAVVVQAAPRPAGTFAD